MNRVRLGAERLRCRRWQVSVLAAACLTFGLLGATPSALTFFRANFSADSFPNFGFDDVIDGCCAQWTRTLARGEGPNGGDALLLTQLPNSVGDFGWGMTKDLPATSQGATRFVRWRMKWSDDSNFRGREQGGGGGIPYSTGKLMMWPSSGGAGIRTTVLWESQHSPSVTGRVKLYIGDANGGYQTDYVVERGVWANIQLRVQSSSSCGTRNGALSIWVNNNDQSRPTRVRGSSSDPWVDTNTGLNICTQDWDSIRLGAYQNKGLQSAGINKIYYGGFEIADSFDPTWSGGSGGTTLPQAPRNLRISPAASLQE